MFVVQSDILCNKIDTSILCVSVFVKDMGWYWGFIVRLHYEETMIYLFTGYVTSGTTNIFKEIQYNCWLIHIKDQFYSIIVNITPEGAHFLIRKSRSPKK